mgnify:FL=1
MVKNDNLQNIWNNFLQLKEQSGIIKILLKSCRAKDITSWQNIVKYLPTSIYNFARRYLILTLSNGTNLKRWTIKENSSCALCTAKET